MRGAEALAAAREAAEAICRPLDPPDWLAPWLAQRAARQIGPFIRRGGKPPAPSMFRADLEHVASLARRLAAALEPAEIGIAMARVEPHDEGLYDALLALPGQRQPKVAQDLVALAERAGRAAGGRYIPGKATTARLLTGLVVVEAWRAIHGREPGDQNKNATEAIGRLWAATGGGERKKDWRSAIRDAKAVPCAPGISRHASWRMEIRSAITAAMHSAP